MQYAELKAKGFMIGSGVVEAACKTLVTQRLKQSGMRWSVSGAQAILTPRGWDQSERFDKAWALVAATFHAEVTVLANVIALRPPETVAETASGGVTMRTTPCRFDFETLPVSGAPDTRRARATSLGRRFRSVTPRFRSSVDSRCDGGFVYSRSALDAARPHEVPHILISITSSPDDMARVRSNPACLGILRLSFVDAESASDQYTERDLFSREHATMIWSFVLQHRLDIERIIVHCDAGVSRSPAVGAALARVFNGSDAEFFGGRYRPNMRVYRMLLETNSALPT